MDLKEMEAKMQELENKVRVMEDIEAINKLQRCYGYFIEHWLYQDIIDCFADSPDAELNILVGVYKGIEGVRRYFEGEKHRSQEKELLHQVMQLSGVVEINPDGKTAQGRWFGFGCVSVPNPANRVVQNISGGVYNAKYIKQDGKWKILKLIWNPTYTFDPRVGWVAPDRVADAGINSLQTPPRPDEKRPLDTRYPSGYVAPFPFKHPVTGKPTTERKHNANFKIKEME